MKKLNYYNSNYKLIKTSQPKTSDPYGEYYSKMCTTKEGNYLFDRFWIGECIYGPIYRGSNGLSKREQQVLRQMSQNDLYIITHTDEERIKKVFEERGEEYTQSNDVSKINDFYKEFIMEHSGRINILAYDFMKEGQDLNKFYDQYITEYV